MGTDANIWLVGGLFAQSLAQSLVDTSDPALSTTA